MVNMKTINKDDLFENLEKTRWNLIMVADMFEVYPIEVYYQAKHYGFFDFLNDEKVDKKILDEYEKTKNAMTVAANLKISIYRVNIILHKNKKKRVKWSDYEREVITRYFKKLPYKDMENILPGRHKTSVYHYVTRNQIPFTVMKPSDEEKEYIKRNPECTVEDIQTKFKHSYEEAFIIKYFYM